MVTQELVTALRAPLSRAEVSTLAAAALRRRAVRICGDRRVLKEAACDILIAIKPH